MDAIDISTVGCPNPFSATHGLLDKFVVTYAGNIGKPQGLEVLVGAAEILRFDTTMLFLVVGDGAEKAGIERLASEKGLANIVFLPYQPYSYVPQIYAASSICLVMQAAGTGTTALPSKAVQIVGAGRPVVAVADAQSDLATFVCSTASGVVVTPRHPEELAAQLTTIRDDYRAWLERAQAARPTAIETYSRQHVVDAYSQLIRRLVTRAEA